MKFGCYVTNKPTLTSGFTWHTKSGLLGLISGLYLDPAPHLPDLCHPRTYLLVILRNPTYIIQTSIFHSSNAASKKKKYTAMYVVHCG